MGRFKATSLRNKIYIKHGFSFKGEFFASEGEYIILTPGNFHETGGFKFDSEKAKYYNGKFPEEYICAKGDLIVAMTEQAEGLLGSSAIVPENNRFLHNQRIGLVTVDENEIDKSYLYHVFNTKSVRQQLRRSSSGSKVKHTSPDRIYDVSVNLPSLPEQQKIAAVLSALDAKIELNQRINAELEQMAKTLYDYWFVQFDFPDENGKPYKSAGGKMVWNEELKREIPLGWEVKELGDIATITAGGDKPSVFSLEKTDTCSVPIYSNGISNEGLYGYTDKAKITKKSITVSARGTIGYCVLRNKPFVPIIRLIVIMPHLSFSTKYFEEYVKGFEFEKSGSVQQQLTVPQVSKIDVLYPPMDILKKYDAVTSPLISQSEVLKEESQQLIELRDWLLPMLMNGQVQVG